MSLPPLSWALAPVVLGAVLVLQLSPVLPDPVARAAVATCAAAAVLTASRLVRRSPRFATLLLVAAAGAAAWLWAATAAGDRLAQRLPAALEDVPFVVRGVVDELPVPQQRGLRFGLRVEGCERASAGGGPGATRPVARDATPPADASSDDRTADDDAHAPVDEDDARPSCPLPPRVSLSWHRPLHDPQSAAVPAVRADQRWSLVVRLRRPHAQVNPDAFDRELRWLQEGIGAVGTVRSGRLLDDRAGAPLPSVERLRGAVRDALLRAAGNERAREAGVLAALAIGDQAAIDPQWWALFNRTGTGHLMSISGLHVTMLAGLGGVAAGAAWRTRAVARAGWPLRVPARTARLVASVAVAFGYALLAGWGVPARRTCFMLAAGAALVASGRTASIAATLGAAAIAVVALDPWAPLSAGFWLSFVAVAAIVWAGAAPRDDDGRIAAALRGAVRTQWAATLSLLPLGAWFFASASVVGPIANAVAIPLVAGVVTPLALAGGAVALVTPEWAGWLVGPAASLVGALVHGLEALAGWPHAAVALPRPGLASLVVACAGCALLLAPSGVPRRAWGALALLPLALVPLRRPGPGELWLTALDVGQGTAVVVQVGDRTLVYDTGPPLGPAQDTAGRTIVPWLQAQGIGRPDVLVVSHLDADHSGGALTLLRALPPARLESSLPQDHPIVAAAARASRCRRGDGWRWDDVEFEWLHPADPPERSRGSATNATSCVLRIRALGGTALLAGDIEAAQERRLVELFGAQGLASDVLLVPHHGSATSSTEAFVDAVSPRWGVVQAAYRSRFRHPHPKVVERYERRGIELLRSDADGAVQIRLRPDAPAVVVRSRHAPARYWRVPVPP